MQSLEVSGAVRPIYGSLGVKRLITLYSLVQQLTGVFFLMLLLLTAVNNWYIFVHCRYPRHPRISAG